MLKAKIALYEPVASGRYFQVSIKNALHEENDEFKWPPKLMILSDISGNFKGFQHLLMEAGVINKKLQWTFKDGHLVITGNCLGNDQQIVECLWLIYTLEEKAARKGGYVHFILGDQEIRHLNSDWRYTQPRYANHNALASGSYSVLYDGNNELWRWLCTKNVIEKIGDVLFVHGRFLPGLCTLGLSMREINRKARLHYIGKSDASMLNERMHVFDPDAPSLLSVITEEEKLDDILSRFNVHKIVTSDQLVDEVTSYFNGKLINVHTDHANLRSEALLIKGAKFHRFRMNKQREKLK